MSAIDELVAHNRAFADSRPIAPLDAQPSRRIAIVTCMDSRLDVFAALGLGHGEAHVLRNAGGVVTDDTIRSLAISQRRLGTREAMLIHSATRPSSPIAKRCAASSTTSRRTACARCC